MSLNVTQGPKCRLEGSALLTRAHTQHLNAIDSPNSTSQSPQLPFGLAPAAAVHKGFLWILQDTFTASREDTSLCTVLTPFSDYRCIVLPDNAREPTGLGIHRPWYPSLSFVPVSSNCCTMWSPSKCDHTVSSMDVVLQSVANSLLSLLYHQGYSAAKSLLTLLHWCMPAALLQALLQQLSCCF